MKYRTARLRGVSRADSTLLVGASLVGVAIALSIFGPLIVPYDPEAATPDILQSPSTDHWFGTDAVGIDVFSRVVAAFRVDVLIALTATAVSFAGGVTLGAICGYGFSARLARAVSWGLLRAADMVQALPVFILALALVGMTGPSVRNVVISIAFVNLPIFLRLTRGAVLVTQREAYVDAARVMGLRDRQILLRHVLPNSVEPVIANASIAIGGAILLTASLSFIGAGIRPPAPEWGAIIATGSRYLITGQWWITVLPGLVLSIVVLGFGMLGEGLRRRWDPAGRLAADVRSAAR